MARVGFKHEDAQSGFGFQEGWARIQKSRVAVHQYPKSKDPKKAQSDKFTAMRWTLALLDSQRQPKHDDQDAPMIEILPVRLGPTDEIRPGQIDPKDFDNLDVEAKDLGDAVDTEGNAIFAMPDKKIQRGWAIMEESMRKCGFKAEISGRGIATDFEGMVAHFKTVEGEPYVAKKGANKGEKVTPKNLVIDKIVVFPYQLTADEKKALGAEDVKSSPNPTPAPSTSGSTTTTTSPSTASSPTNGEPSEADILAGAVQVIKHLTPGFFTKVAKGQDVARDAFQKAFTGEVMMQKMGGKLSKLVCDYIKNAENLKTLVMETEMAFMLSDDEKTVNFS
jgi:hypothetical protein